MVKQNKYTGIMDHRRKFWLSIRISKNCLFSRRYGMVGKLIGPFSIMLRLFNKDLI